MENGRFLFLTFYKKKKKNFEKFSNARVFDDFKLLTGNALEIPISRFSSGRASNWETNQREKSQRERKLDRRKEAKQGERKLGFPRPEPPRAESPPFFPLPPPFRPPPFPAIEETLSPENIPNLYQYQSLLLTPVSKGRE